MQPHDPNYKPKTTIIPANPGFWHHGNPVVAWVIEDGQVARPVALDGSGGHVDFTYDPRVRGSDV